MNSSDIVGMSVAIGLPLIAAIFFIFPDWVFPKIERWWNAIKLLPVAIAMAPLTEWEKYKVKLSKDAKERLDYDIVRLLEFDCYDGKVFHRRDGSCDLEPFIPKKKISPGHNMPMSRSQLSYEVERKEILRMVVRL